MDTFGIWIRRLTLSVLLIAGAWSADASAQCLPDGLDAGTCCTPVPLILPTFPLLQQNCRFGSFNNCAIQINPQLCATFGPPIPAMIGPNPVCGVYLIRFSFRTCGTNLGLWNGTLRATYSRNWEEFVPPATQRGVWRFLLNGDMVPTLNLPAIPVARPPCITQYGKAYFSGYIDYAFDCNTSQWSAAWALNHECDFATHVAGTARPIAGGSHPNRSYSFVSPSAGFVFSPSSGPIGAGAITGEAMRKNDWSTLPNICRAEEPFGSGGGMLPVRAFCECVPSNPALPQQYHETALAGAAICGSSVNTSNPPTGPIPFVQKRIGSWTVAGTFHEPSTLLFNFGYMQHNDGCIVPGPSLSNQYVEGVETLGNGIAIGVTYTGIALGYQFLDLASSNSVSGAPMVGAPHVAWFLLNLNL